MAGVMSWNVISSSSPPHLPNAGILSNLFATQNISFGKRMSWDIIHQYHKQKFKVNIFTKKILRVIQFCRFLHSCPFDDPRHHKAWPIVKYEIIYCLPICNKIRILHLFVWKYNFHFNSNSPSFFQERHLYQLGSNSNRLGSGVYHSQILLPYDLNSFAHRDFI